MSNPFAGALTYRSLLGNSAFVGDDSAKLQALLFAEEVRTVKDAADTVFDGKLSCGSANITDLKGIVTPAQAGHPAHIHIVGTGRAGYDDLVVDAAPDQRREFFELSRTYRQCREK
jgi:hypothetical protein